MEVWKRNGISKPSDGQIAIGIWIYVAWPRGAFVGDGQRTVGFISTEYRPRFDEEEEKNTCWLPFSSRSSL